MLRDQTERLQKLNREHAAVQIKLQTATERANLTQALRGVKMDELHNLTRSSSKVAEAIGRLTQVLPGLEQSGGVSYDAMLGN
tara:strand:- start:937 stop:1185 length:249 start_codon:yes stop_codon:yes gene_type:complete